MALHGCWNGLHGGIVVAFLSSTVACGSDEGASDASGSGAETGATSRAATGGGSAETGGQSGTATSGADTSADTGSVDEGSTSGFKFDVGGTGGGTEGEGCGCGSQIAFSYVWPSNSNIGQVSKINTETIVEEGRYLTSADGLGSPSRSSVSLSGLHVAVNNRAGGVIKIRSRTEDCDPMKNGVPGLQTSTGPNDVLGWGEDDCVDWYIDPYGYTTQRPIGWIPAPLDQETCEYIDEKLWTSGCDSGTDTYIYADRVDGATGTVEDHVEVTGFACTGFGGYGGAVDADGNFWIIDLGTTLAKVDHDTLDITIYTMPLTGYGVTVDTKGRPWVSSSMKAGNASAARFDPMTQTWDLADNILVSAQTGIQEDAQGRMWMNYWSYDGGSTRGVTYIDRDTMMVGPPRDLPSYGKGISIDLNGKVWAIGTFTDNAVRYDPDTDQVDVYENLQYPYTYSDMTGWALQNTACNPAG